MGNYWSYMRISTKEERGMQKFNRQSSALEKYAQDNNIHCVGAYQDDASGKNLTAPPGRTSKKQLNQVIPSFLKTSADSPEKQKTALQSTWSL